MESTNQHWWKSVPPFLCTGHCEFNDASPYFHVQETIPVPFQHNCIILLIPSIDIELNQLISPAMEYCLLSLFSNSPLCSLHSDQLVRSIHHF